MPARERVFVNSSYQYQWRPVDGRLRRGCCSLSFSLRGSFQFVSRQNKWWRCVISGCSDYCAGNNTCSDTMVGGRRGNQLSQLSCRGRFPELNGMECRRLPNAILNLLWQICLLCYVEFGYHWKFILMESCLQWQIKKKLSNESKTNKIVC